MTNDIVRALVIDPSAPSTLNAGMNAGGLQKYDSRAIGFSAQGGLSESGDEPGGGKRVPKTGDSGKHGSNRSRPKSALPGPSVRPDSCAEIFSI